jgi:uncharacterized protein (DUF1778 family)
MYGLMTYIQEFVMPKAVAEQNERLEFRIPAAEKARINKAAGLSGLDLTSFVRFHALQAANEAIERAERLQISERDAQRLLAYLDSPAEPNARLKRAAHSLPKDMGT